MPKVPYTPGDLVVIFVHDPITDTRTWKDYQQALFNLVETEVVTGIFHNTDGWQFVYDKYYTTQGPNVSSAQDPNVSVLPTQGPSVSSVQDSNVSFPPPRIERNKATLENLARGSYVFSIKLTSTISGKRNEGGPLGTKPARSMAVLTVHSGTELLDNQTLGSMVELTANLLTKPDNSPGILKAFSPADSGPVKKVDAITFNGRVVASAIAEQIDPNPAAKANLAVPDPILPIGEGGPGGAPIPYPAPGKPKVPEDKIPCRFTLPPNLAAGNEDVHVFILDTVPRPKAMTRAFTDWGSDHPLVRELLDDTNSRLKVLYTDKQASANLPDDVSHPLVDHGLFIAGLVYSIARDINGLKIYLVEVLNEYGVGDVVSVEQGLHEIERRIEADQLKNVVINCSFHFEPETLDENIDFTQDVGGNLKRFMKEGVVCDNTGPNGPEYARIVVVAAAGNERTFPLYQPRPNAQLPAALEPIFGIAALNHDPTEFASYTNQAKWEINSTCQYAVFGGDVISTQGPLRVDPDYGILGLYIGPKFLTKHDPCDNKMWEWNNKNPNGWARWAGTSFSTAVMSGIMALLASNGHFGHHQYDAKGEPIPGTLTHEMVIDFLHNNKIAQDIPDEPEKGIRVVQNLNWNNQPV